MARAPDIAVFKCRPRSADNELFEKTSMILDLTRQLGNASLA
jgi:hypothetical protein